MSTNVTTRRPHATGVRRGQPRSKSWHVDAPAEPAVVDWRNRSVCREEDPELFFPVGNTGPALLQIEEAKAVCGRCPVRAMCLSWALETGQDTGVWGGMSEDERRSMKRRAARDRARTAHEGTGGRA